MYGAIGLLIKKRIVYTLDPGLIRVENVVLLKQKRFPRLVIIRLIMIKQVSVRFVEHMLTGMSILLHLRILVVVQEKVEAPAKAAEPETVATPKVKLNG